MMFAKLQLFDCGCFHILGSTKLPPGVGISTDKVESVKKHRGKRVLEALNGNGGPNSSGRVYRRAHDWKVDIVNKPRVSQHDLVKELCGEHMGNAVENGRVESRRNGAAQFRRGRRNGSGGNVQVKCSTKCVSYGGSIPAILQALERVVDLNEALRPWAESLSNKERSIILKEQTSWERALEIFEWFKRKGCYELNVIHYNIMLKILGKAQKWSLVESLWVEMMKRRILPTNSTYGTLIDVYSKGGRKEEALRWLKQMNRQGMEADEVTMGTVIQTYKRSGEFRKAEEFFKKWSLKISLKDEGQSTRPTAVATSESASQGQVLLNSYTYNTLIDTYGKAGQLKGASETFAQMLREGIAPNTITFNTMIHVCGNHGRLEEVASLMQKMEELRCPPDTRTYNILISLHAKHDNIRMAASYFSKMKEACLEPDLVSYRTLLYAFSIRHMVREAEDLISEMDERGIEIDEFTQSALTRMYIEAGMLDKSWLWFKRFHLEGNMTSECYSANIDAYGERGHILEAEKVFSCCQEAKKLTVLGFNVMIKAYGISKRFDEACQLFDGMENYGVAPDKCSYNSLIQILASADLPHIAKPYVKKMQEAGLVSDCIPYCAIISSFAKLGELEMAEGLYEEMVKFGVQPDLLVYGILINAFADVGSIKEALGYVDVMRNAGLPTNAVICNSLIKLYTKVGYLKEAQETYGMLQSSQEGPDVYSSNCMIDLYTERSMVKQAEEIFTSLRRKGHANEFSYAMMLCMYKRIGMFGEAIRIAKKMRELGFLTSLLSYNNVLGLYAMDGRFKEAVETFKEMVNASIQPDDYTFKSLGLVLVKCGVPKQAVGKLEVTRKMDAQCGMQAWMSTLLTVVEMNDDDDDDDDDDGCA
ncbi:pentatricopeptide repeat-containing protein At3g23020 [Malania oleifera]|uniref:pentatricopeptide repeat-containing protein At3g23020 n=1 Tax=Malania oleifera TaxID=397392 RepID=UPI0025AE9D1C|nr:pentatricopeptide repeat-containing protein At3g23020 [Malania oleifera]